MWKFKAAVVLVVLTGTLFAGIATVYGFWWWNAAIDVEGADVRTVWTVTDDPDGADDYRADIRLFLPRGADASIVDQADNERVRIHHTRRLDCTDEGIEALVLYRVSPNRGADGSEVSATVTANGDVIGEEQGRVGRTIRLNVEIPGTCWDDDGGDHDDDDDGDDHDDDDDDNDDDDDDDDDDD